MAAELVARIVGGVHPAGTTLPAEPVLCETFSVSRTVVREAARRADDEVVASRAIFTHITEAWLVRREGRGDPERLTR